MNELHVRRLAQKDIIAEDAVKVVLVEKTEPVDSILTKRHVK